MKILQGIGHREQIGQPNKHVKFITINVYSSDTLDSYSLRTESRDALAFIRNEHKFSKTFLKALNQLRYTKSHTLTLLLTIKHSHTHTHSVYSIGETNEEKAPEITKKKCAFQTEYLQVNIEKYHKNLCILLTLGRVRSYFIHKFALRQHHPRNSSQSN